MAMDKLLIRAQTEVKYLSVEPPPRREGGEEPRLVIAVGDDRNEHSITLTSEACDRLIVHLVRVLHHGFEPAEHPLADLV